MIITYQVYGKLIKNYSPFKGFTGLMVRGLFGLALRRLVCIKPDVSKCIECPYYRKCFYSRVFEATSRIKPDAKIAKRGGLAGITRPYTVSPVYVKGRSLNFKINLFGHEVISNEPIIVLALLEMGSHGFGMDPILGERRRFVIQKITAKRPREETQRIVYDFEEGYRYTHISKYYRDILEPFEYPAYKIISEKPSHILISFKTPVRIIHGGKMVEEIPLHAVIMNLARKYSLLCEYYNVGKPLTADEARNLKEVVSKYTKLVKAEYKRVRLHRYSIESNQIQSLGEFVKGSYLYSIDKKLWRTPEAYLMVELLLLGRYTHVGTLASAGCGEYEIYWTI